MTWVFDIFEIITWASRAFVAYYALQSFLAASAAIRRGAWLRGGLYAAACLLAVAIIIVAKPASV